MKDSYIYPGTNVLINKLGITSFEELESVERAICIEAEVIGLPSGNFDFKHLQSIHKALFGELYAWAGEVRTVNIAKSAMFCATGFIEAESKKLFSQLSKENNLSDYKDRSTFIIRLSHYFAEINAIHPFREGNGRTTRAFIEQLAEHNGYIIDFQNMNRPDYIQAAINSHAGENQLLEKLFDLSITTPNLTNNKPELLLTEKATDKQLNLKSNEDVLKHFEQYSYQEQ